jgi:hypothetical protein
MPANGRWDLTQLLNILPHHTWQFLKYILVGRIFVILSVKHNIRTVLQLKLLETKYVHTSKTLTIYVNEEMAEIRAFGAKSNFHLKFLLI